MNITPFIVGLPTESRSRAFDFYTEGLGLGTAGEPDEDGIPEPLQIVLNDGARIMLIPTGGFGWVTEGRDIADHGQSECMLVMPAETEDAVDELIERARRAGADIITEPGEQRWGYAGAFIDPDGHAWMVREGLQ